MRNKMSLKYHSIFILVCFIFLETACGLSDTIPTSTVPDIFHDNAGETLSPGSTEEPFPTNDYSTTTGRYIKPSITTTSTSTKISDTRTPTASLTPYPTLLPQGPYLLVDKYFGEGPLTLLDVTGRGRKLLELPHDFFIPDLQRAVSPNGKWLVFYSGSVEAPYDLAINLMSIPDGKIITVTKLLLGNVSGNLDIVAEYYADQGYESLGSETLKSLVFDNTLTTFEWSPDGRVLAFSGQLDGPSSDLYCYDVQANEIRRMTDDMGILSGITWSPNGNWLVIQNAIPGTSYVGATLHRIKASDSTVKDPPALEEGFWWAGEGWITPSIYLITGSPDGGDLYGLRYLNVETGTITNLWPETYFAYAIDPQAELFAISGAPERSSDGQYIEYGLYMVTLDGQRKKASDMILWTLKFLGRNDSSWFLGSDGKDIVTISKNGNIIEVGSDDEKVLMNAIISPDKQWYVIYKRTKAAANITMYSADGRLVEIFSEIKATGILWRADSSGLILTNEKELYSLTIPDGQILELDQCQPNNNECWFSLRDIAWIP